MNITQTSNSVLALNLKLDASYISRLRRGQRNTPKNEAWVRAMSSYFARHCCEEYQRKALAHVMDLRSYSFEDGKLADIITQWLYHEKKHDVEIVENFLAGLTGNKNKRMIQDILYPDEKAGEIPQADVSVFYGMNGKRQAVLYFLSEVLGQSKPRTLLLFSDESMGWMTEDREFAAKWALLLDRVLAKGNSIRIIHTVSRDFDEMLKAINQWLPHYMSGAIVPYYYPKKRDGIFKRTLFIAPEVSAVISSSVGNMLDQAANLLIRDGRAIEAFQEEFRQYFCLCKPLMRIFLSKDKEAYFKSLLEFDKEQSDSIIRTESLSLLTMPETVASRLVARAGIADDFFPYFQKNRIHILKKYLLSSSFTEIIHLYSLEKVRTGKVKVAFSDILKGGTAYYTAEEYILHLENIVRLLRTYDHFHVAFADDLGEERYMIYAKEDAGTVVAKTSAPPVVLAINETNMTAAFWDFLKNMIDEGAYSNMSNEDSAIKLVRYIQQLRRITV